MIKNIFFIVLLCFASSTFATTGYYLWVQKAEFPPVARHRCTGFSIGNKGYMGLGHVNAGAVSLAYADFWEYDQATNSWAQKADFGGGDRYGAVGFSIGNKGYIGTGRIASGITYNDFWEYNPATNVWTQKAPFPGTPRDGGTGFSLNGKGYMGLGYYADWFEYTPATNSWAFKANFPGATPDYAPTFVIDSLGYVCTGSYTIPCPLYAYSPTMDAWIPKANFPGGSRFGATGFAIDGKGFIGIGCDFGYQDFKDFYEYNPVADSWDSLPDFPGARRHYVPGFNIGNRGYCGTGTNGTNLKDFWEYFYYVPDTVAYGIHEIGVDAVVNIFPNPVNTSAEISFNIAPCDFDLFDASGRKVFSEKNISGSFHFKREKLSAGIYLYSVSVHGEKIKAGKIILL